MRHLKSIILIISILVFNIISILAQNTNENIPLRVVVSGFSNNKGQAILHLYRKTDDVPKKSFWSIKAKIVNNTASFVITNLRYEDYAIIVIHDENGNDKLDHNSMGMPNETMGYSNNWQFGIFSGMPSFEKLKFTYSKNYNSVTIKMDN